MIWDVDTFLFDKVFSFSGTIEALDTIFIFIAEYSRIFMAVILFIGFLGLFFETVSDYRQRRNSLLGSVFKLAAAGLVVLIPIAASDALREIIMRPRPFVAMDITPLTEQDIRPSLPSNHTAASFAIAGFYLLYQQKFFPIAAFLALSVGFSRIYIGAHYPLDILVGAALGLLPAAVFVLIRSKIKKREERNKVKLRY